MAGPEIAALQVSPQSSSSFSCLPFLHPSVILPHCLSFLDLPQSQRFKKKNKKNKSPFFYLPQSLLSSLSQLCHSFGSRVDWLEQEVSTLRSHVMALHSELQDVCQGDSGAFVPVSLIELAVSCVMVLLRSDFTLTLCDGRCLRFFSPSF